MARHLPRTAAGRPADERPVVPGDVANPLLERRGYPGFDAATEVEQITTPADWARLGRAGGTPFAVAHTFTQTSPFRPNNLYGDNVVFAGSGTRPGIGIPMVLISGRLAAERILGQRPAR